MKLIYWSKVNISTLVLMLSYLAAIAGCAPVRQAIDSPLVAEGTGAELLRMCEAANVPTMNSEDVADAIYCIGYIEGFVYGADSERLVRESDSLKGQGFCLPEGDITIEQLVQTVTEYLRGNPDVLDIEARNLVYAALALSFPCDDQS